MYRVVWPKQALTLAQSQQARAHPLQTACLAFCSTGGIAPSTAALVWRSASGWASTC